ncbi:MAG TPA: M28 family peptidase [Solirubrobacterales bacterium]|nr:M28 family peptidase [Solirubrobacterales bacterium]
MSAAVGERIERICEYSDRLPGSDAERRLTNALAAELEADGMRVEVETAWVHPQWPIVHLLHCLVAIAGSVVAPVAPVAGFALVLAAATSAHLDLSARLYLLRGLLFRRASQSLHARGEADAAGERVILCANLDAPRTGAVYNRGPMRLLDAAARRLPVASSPTRIWFWSIALLLVPVGARMAGLDAAWLDYVQLAPTLVLIVACFALGEIALSPASPGANANASGVAAALAATRQLAADPPDWLEVELLLFGGGETTMEGMSSFLRAHRKDLDRERTRFISFESVGRGEPGFAVSGGLAVSLPFDRELVDACTAVAAAREDEERRAEPFRDVRATAATVARTHRRRAIAITCREAGRALPEGHHTPGDLPATVDPGAVEAAARLAADAIRLLDRDLGRERPHALASSADRRDDQ